MSLDHDFISSSTGRPEQIIDMLERKLELTRSSPTSGARSGLFVSACQPEGDETDALVEAHFGFSPGVEVRFSLSQYQGTEFEFNQKLMVRAITTLLDSDQADALFLFNNEQVLLWRSSGELTISPTWTELRDFNLLGMFTTPYKESDISSPFL